MGNIFSVLNSITLEKRKWSDLELSEQQSFNPWMINKFLSMREEYCDIVNTIQKNTFQLTSEQVYKIYLDLIPKNKVWLKYIKSTKEKINSELLQIVSKYYESSEREAKDYLKILDKEKIEEILHFSGKNDKEIKELLK